MQFRILTIPVEKSKPEYSTEEIKAKKYTTSGSKVRFLEGKKQSLCCFKPHLVYRKDTQKKHFATMYLKQSDLNQEKLSCYSGESKKDMEFSRRQMQRFWGKRNIYERRTGEACVKLFKDRKLQ